MKVETPKNKKIMFILRFRLSVIFNPTSAVLEGASKDAQSPSFTSFFHQSENNFKICVAPAPKVIHESIFFSTPVP